VLLESLKRLLRGVADMTISGPQWFERTEELRPVLTSRRGGGGWLSEFMVASSRVITLIQRLVNEAGSAIYSATAFPYNGTPVMINLDFNCSTKPRTRGLCSLSPSCGCCGKWLVFNSRVASSGAVSLIQRVVNEAGSTCGKCILGDF